VGVSLLVVREGREILLGKRLGSHGQGEWGTPGGHQELGERYEETAQRELKEECGVGVKVTYPRFLCVSNLRHYIPESGRHYTDVAFVSHWLGGEPTVMEPGKCAEWRWFPFHGLPREMFAVVPNLVSAFQTSRHYFS
jgi:8-oxo-dGTP diphosphatase